MIEYKIIGNQNTGATDDLLPSGWQSYKFTDGFDIGKLPEGEILEFKYNVEKECMEIIEND